MKRQQIVLIFLGVLMAVVCLVTGWFLVSAMIEKNAAAEERNQAYAEVQGIYGGKVFPSAETIARVNADQKALEAWLFNASNLVHEGELQVEAKSPTGFKQTLQTTVRALSAHPGAANGKIVAGGFHFGFDKYLGESDSLPSTEHVDRLTRQLTIIEMLCKELYAANILELKAVTRETFEEQPLPGQPGSEPQPVIRRRRRRDEASAPAPVAAVRETSGYFSKQRFTLEFLARPAAFITALNRLAAMKLFVVVAETEFRKTGDPLTKRTAKKKEGAAPGQGEGGEAVVDPATLTHVQRLVTDPDLEPPVNVKLDIDVYSFEGV